MTAWGHQTALRVDARLPVDISSLLHSQDWQASPPRGDICVVDGERA
jgi:hypothetical protein